MRKSNQRLHKFVACAICNLRKEKRYCPALHDKICPLCCGTEREVRFDCPSDCVYLQEARSRELPRSLEQLDPAPLFPNLEVRQQVIYEREPLLAGLSFVLAKAARADRNLHDRDLLDALGGLAAGYHTLVKSGLHYSAPVASLPQQAIIAELEKALSKYRELEQQHLGYAGLKDSDVLQILVFLLRTGYARTSGRARSRALIDFLLQQFPEQEIAAPESHSSLIIP